MRLPVLVALVAVFALVVGCGEDSTSDEGGSKPAATATSDVRSEYYRAMDALAYALDKTVSGAVARDANALAGIKDVLG